MGLASLLNPWWSLVVCTFHLFLICTLTSFEVEGEDEAEVDKAHKHWTFVGLEDYCLGYFLGDHSPFLGMPGMIWYIFTCISPYSLKKFSPTLPFNIWLYTAHVCAMYQCIRKQTVHVYHTRSYQYILVKLQHSAVLHLLRFVCLCFSWMLANAQLQWHSISTWHLVKYA